MIPLANPWANYKAHEREICQAVHDVLEDGVYIGGHWVERFEQEFAAYVGTKYAIGVNSGTDALKIAMRALKVEAITVPANTALATVAAILDASATPILVGADDPAALTVHLYGKAALSSHTLIEDCAQACGGMIWGKRLGSLGTIGCFSFYPTKNLGAIGDGGMIVTNNHDLAMFCREMREYGWNRDRTPQRIGINSRLDPIQAAILSIKLKYLDGENERRRQIARRYEFELNGIVKVPSPINHCFHLYVIECDNRDGLVSHLNRHGVGTGIHYSVPIHRQPVYMGQVKIGADLGEIDRLSSRILSLPMYPELTEAEVDKVIECICEFYA